MGVHPTPTTPAKPQQTEEERAQALKAAALELGQAIALGLVPYLAQAIDIYDTVESLWVLHGAETEPAKEEAKFDLILALIGWVPGPGDGVKKTLRLVNQDPQRFAPILFDLLRKVLEICKVDTSPETLLDGLFNAGKLHANIAAIRQAIEDSELFAQLSPESQDTIKQGLRYVQAELPALLGIVERRLLRWKKLQPNSSARVEPSGKHKTGQPAKQHADTGRQGSERAAHGAPGGMVNATLAAEALETLQNKLIGVLGEHIADYHCLQHFGWGQVDWSGHDHGAEGQWPRGNPDDMREGKLSKGASGRLHKLYRLDHSANPKGIDSVWRAMTHNGGKPYAVVEAKSEMEILIPKMLKKNPNFQPSMLSKLGITGIPKGEEMLEPYEDEAPQKANKGKGSVKRGKASASGAPSTGKARSDTDGPEIRVQMSHEWIRENMRKAVGDIARKILRVLPGGQMNYERHLLYTAQWMECAKQHSQALLEGTAHIGSTHENHHIPPTGIYNEQQVRDFVNRKKASLRKKYGDLPTLKAET
jgi:hypothetical protein